MNDWDTIDEDEFWICDIKEKCEHKFIPDHYVSLEDYETNPTNPELTENIEQIEFCSLKNNTDDYSCDYLTCPKVK